MSSIEKRTIHIKGAPREAGFSLGQALGKKLEENIRSFLESWPARDGILDPVKLQAGAMPWFDRLPERFRLELEGVADGSQVPLGRIAELGYAEQCAALNCSAVVYFDRGKTWVARNNDVWRPKLWGYTIIHEINGRMPRISFGLEGDTFTPTGMNREKLWLHYNYLEKRGSPSGSKPCYDCFVFLTEALETCRNLHDVETLLNRADRTGGMLLFAVDGKTNESAVIECACDSHSVRRPSGNWIAGTNHYIESEQPKIQKIAERQTQTSQSRIDRMEQLLSGLNPQKSDFEIVPELQKMLADDGVEQRFTDRCTVTSHVACPADGLVWYAFGDGPAASSGKWGRVDWPWRK
ncbi:MAG: C45 family peptidase [candidate division Zixibacteria bacterium]|nr:C45 family peptidase [candidate division Zixibacteria bacterium]